MRERGIGYSEWVDREGWRKKINLLYAKKDVKTQRICILKKECLVLKTVIRNLFVLSTHIPRLMEPGGSMPHAQGLSSKYILSQINPNSRSNTYFFKFHFNIVLILPS